MTIAGVAPTREAVGVPTFDAPVGAGEASGLRIMAFVYILENKLGRYYVGSTLDMRARLRHHVGGYTPSTRRLGTVHLVLHQEYKTLAEARSVERKLKKLRRKDYIRKIIEQGYIKIKPA